MFPVATTTELKGLAIVLVVFSHIGYFLVQDHIFLAPVSNYAGVGVDLFLILSGYGVMTSALQKPLSITDFYKKRLGKIYLPVVITVLIFLCLDAAVLHTFYSGTLTIKNILGFFPSADLYRDINSPLWFITPLLAQYLFFPLVFRKKYPWAAPVGILVFNSFLLSLNLTSFFGITPGVFNLYYLHFLGFPLGLFLAAYSTHIAKFSTSTMELLTAHVDKKFQRPFFLFLSTVVLWVTLRYSAVGHGWIKEEVISLFSALLLILVFVVKKTESRFLLLLGQFSFEIYLVHWPLLYRYQFLYPYLPASVATVLYMGIFLLIGYIYQAVPKLKFVRKVS